MSTKPSVRDEAVKRVSLPEALYVSAVGLGALAIAMALINLPIWMPGASAAAGAACFVTGAALQVGWRKSRASGDTPDSRSHAPPNDAMHTWHESSNAGG